MARLLPALARGVRFRCPACGVGRFYRFWGVFQRDCRACGHVYLRDPGDWTGSSETSLILTFAVGAVAWILLGGFDLGARARAGAALAVGLLAFGVLFPRVRGLWIGVLSVWADPAGAPARGVDPMEGDPEWEHPSLLDRP